MNNASYAKCIVRRHAGNPLIEALPPLRSKEQWAELLTNFPDFFESDRLLPKEARVAMVDTVNDFFQPFPVHLRLASAMDAALREGYVGRHPFNPRTLQHSHFIAEQGKDGVGGPDSECLTAKSMFLTGLTRVGKTRSLTRILSTYPQVIKHKQHSGRVFPDIQVVYMKVSVSKNASLKDFLMSILRQFDVILGVKEYAKRGRNANGALITVVAEVARELHLGLLVVDELQRLVNRRTKGKGGQKGTASIQMFLHSFMDDIGVPVVFCGTYATYEVFAGNLQEAARICRGGKVDIERFKKDSKQWQVFVEGFWRYQYVAVPKELERSDLDLLHDLTKGIPDVALALWTLVQKTAIGKSDSLDHGLMRTVMKDSLGPLMPALEALDSKDMSIKLAYDDLVPGREEIHQAAAKYKENMVLQTIGEIVKTQFDERFGATAVPSSSKLNDAGSGVEDLKVVADERKDSAQDLRKRLSGANAEKEIEKLSRCDLK